jgi:hypothetical protein
MEVSTNKYYTIPLAIWRANGSKYVLVSTKRCTWHLLASIPRKIGMLVFYYSLRCCAQASIGFGMLWWISNRWSPQNRILISYQFLPKLSIRLQIFTQIIHEYPKFWGKFNNFSKKSKAVVYFKQYEYVYVLSKLHFYDIEVSTIWIINLEVIKQSKWHLMARQRQKYKDSDAHEQLYETLTRYKTSKA